MGLLASLVLYLAFQRQVEVEGPPGAFALPVLAEDEGRAWTIILVVDFASAEARQVFREVTRVVAEDLRDDAEIVLLHAPSGGCGPENGATFACMAARALTCADNGERAARLRLAGAAFDLQWEPEAMRTYATLRERARSLGIDVESLDVCSQRPETAQRVEGQRRFVKRFGFTEAVAGWLIHRREEVVQAPFGRSATAETLRWIGRCLEKPAECEGR